MAVDRKFDRRASCTGDCPRPSPPAPSDDDALRIEHGAQRARGLGRRPARAGRRPAAQCGGRGGQGHRRHSHRLAHGARRRARVDARHAQQPHRRRARRRRRARAGRRSSLRPRQVRDARRARHRRISLDLVFRAAARGHHRAGDASYACHDRDGRRRRHRGDAARERVRRLVRAGEPRENSGARFSPPTPRTRPATSSLRFSRC